MDRDPSPAIRLRAPAKLNLGLEVLGRRADGYHELRSVLCAITGERVLGGGSSGQVLDDEVRLWPATGIADGPVGLRVLGPFGGEAGDAADNLARRAAEAVAARAGRQVFAAVEVTKRVPAGAGLGGGSADAAAVLRGADLVTAGLRGADPVTAVPPGANPVTAVPPGANPVTGPPPPDLRPRGFVDLALSLGADVPFQVQGGLALVEGVGERITVLPHAELSFAVAFAGDHCATAAVFGELRAEEWSGGTAIAALAQALSAASSGRGTAGPAATAAGVPREWLELIGSSPNALWGPATRLVPALLERAAALRASGWTAPRLTGSGGAFFQACADPGEARLRASAAAAAGFMAWACQSLPSESLQA